VLLADDGEGVGDVHLSPLHRHGGAPRRPFSGPERRPQR
jgi:hypothetical protein